MKNLEDMGVTVECCLNYMNGQMSIDKKTQVFDV
jgi:hypothetical protein